jgi:hypothetical protein
VHGQVFLEITAKCVLNPGFTVYGGRLYQDRQTGGRLPDVPGLFTAKGFR